MSNTTTAVANIDVEEIASTMGTAGLILAANEKLADKAVTAANHILDTIEGQGMSDELDAEANEWQVKAKQGFKILFDRRSPITQMITKFSGLLIAQEGKLDPKKPESVYAKIQKHRDAWATAKALEKRKKEAEILKKQNIAKERISIKADIISQLKTIFNAKLSDFKRSIQNKYNALTLDNLDEVTTYIKERPIVYPVDAFRKLVPTVFSSHLEQPEVDLIIADERENLYDECAAIFRENMEVEIANTLELLPSRINELKEIEKAGAAEKKRLEDAAKARQIAEDRRLKEEADAQAAKDKEKVEATVNMETASTLFDSTAQLAEVQEASAAKTKTGYKLVILNTTGVIELYNFYFSKEGKGLSVEDLLKKTGNQMKTFAEKHALKTGEMIESKNLTYEEDFKAVAKA